MTELPKLGPFRLQLPLGKGGMAMVWRAVHEHHGEAAAIKIMTGKFARQTRFVESFHREVRTMARMNHPNIVTVYDHGELSPQIEQAAEGRMIAGSPYMVMELADSSLAHVDHNRLTWPHVHTILVHILDALAHAHARGLVHRDLKPDNVLFLSDGDSARLKLSDFGVAYSINTTRQLRAEDEVITGTPRFMAPEQILGKLREQGPWTDLYALGCLVYWLTTGRPPFSHATVDETLRSHLLDPRPPLEPSLEIPAGFEEWALRLLARDPDDRFRRAADAAVALTDIAGHATLQELDLTARGADGEAVDLTLIDEPEDTRALDHTWMEKNADTTEPADGDMSSNDFLPPLPTSWRDDYRVADSKKILGVGLALFELRELPLVGRFEHRNALWDSLVDARYTGRPHIVVLDGPQGVGKSRLANWLGHRAHEVGAVEVLSARHSPIAGPADGLGRMFADHLRCTGLAQPQVLETVRDHFAGDDGLDVDQLHQCMALAEFIAAGVDPDFDADSQPFQFGRPEERFAVFKRLLASLADRRPLLLLLDDVHWGADTLRFLRFLLDNSTDQNLPIVAVLTTRNELNDDTTGVAELLSDVRDRPCCRSLSVDPLPGPHHRELIEKLLCLQPDLAARVARRTEGNPLFAIQLVGDWIKRGLLEIGDEGFRLIEGVEPTLPDDIRALLTQRLENITKSSIDSAPVPALLALELAAVLGHEVDGREWDKLCELGNIDVPADLLGTLAAQSLVQLKDGGWSFVHGALRETLLAIARDQERLEDHHRLCARMLRESDDPRRDEFAPRLAHHLLEAREFKEALDPLLRGLRHFVNICEFDDAERFYALHLQTARRLGIGDGDRRIIAAHLQAAQLHTRQANRDRAEALVDECTQHLRDETNLDLLAQALLQLAKIKRLNTDWEEAVDPAQRAKELFDQLGDSHGVARCFLELGYLWGRLKQNEKARKILLAARRHFEELGDEIELARTLHALNGPLSALGEIQRAVEVLEEGRKIFEAHGDLLRAGACFNGLGNIYQQEDDLAKAAKMYRRSVQLRHLAGVENRSVASYLNLGLILIRQRNFEEANRWAKKAVQLADQSNQIPYLKSAHLLVFACMANFGNWEEFDTYFDLIESYFADGFWIRFETALMIHIAGDEARQKGETKRAQRAFQLALEHWRELENAERAEEASEALKSLSSRR